MIAAWCTVLLAAPGVCFLLGWTRIGAARLRVATLIAGVVMLACASLAVVVPELGRWSLPSPVPGGALLRVDALSVVLPALVAGLWLFSVAVTPRMTLDQVGLRRAAAATAITTLMFLSENGLVLVVGWAASVMTLTPARGAPHFARRYLFASCACLAAGAGLLLVPDAQGSAAETAGLVLVAIAAAVRTGMLPVHAWLPALFDHGRLGPSILFCAPQVGTYVMAVLVVPRAQPELLRVVAVAALVTAVYAAALAMVQRSARRACAYLFISQSALVVGGLDCTSEEALTGALVLWLASSLAFTGLARCVLVLEARRGRLDLGKHHGGYERKPLLAVSFLLLGLSCTGFPGTLGFVGEELLLGGAVSDFPVLGFLVVATGAFTGLAVLRMYFSLFCGARSDVIRLDLRPREAVGFAVVVGVLLLTGLLPAPMVRSRAEASEQLLEVRRALPSSRVP